MENGWVDTFRRASDEDAELQAHGKYHSCAFLLGMEEHSYLVKMNGGKVEDVLVDPGPLDNRYQFAIRASAETWRKFGQETPPAMCHGLFAASFREDMSLERGPFGAHAEPEVRDPADRASADHRRAGLETVKEERDGSSFTAHRTRYVTTDIMGPPRSVGAPSSR